MTDQPTTDLTAPERQFLTFALDLAQEQMFSRGDEFTSDDEAALERLRQLTTAAASVPVSVPADGQRRAAVADAEQAADLVTALRGAGAERDKIEAQRYKQERADALRKAADDLEAMTGEAYERALSEDEIGYANGLENAMAELRRMADEEQP